MLKDRTCLTSLRVVTALTVLLASASGSDASAFPAKFQGLWTDSALTCESHKSFPKRLSKENSWVRIGPQEVSGGTQGRFLRMVDQETAQSTDYTNQNITVDFTLRKDGFLEERVTGARAWMLYLRCR